MRKINKIMGTPRRRRTSTQDPLLWRAVRKKSKILSKIVEYVYKTELLF